jgi:hypothetical protein
MRYKQKVGFSCLQLTLLMAELLFASAGKAALLLLESQLLYRQLLVRLLLQPLDLLFQNSCITKFLSSLAALSSSSNALVGRASTAR